MSTNYSGDRNATQAPASPPVDRVSPEVVLPADGDALNAASVAQAFKVLADYTNLEQEPLTEASQWATPFVAWENALGQPITGIDHFGVLRESTYGWTENWDHSQQYAGSGVINRQVGRWQQQITTAGGAIDNPSPGTGLVAGNPFVQQRSIRLTTGTTGGAIIGMSLSSDSVGAIFTDDVLMSVDFQMFADGYTGQAVFFGLAGSGMLPDLNNGCYFLNDAGTGHWLGRSVLTSTTSTHNTGIAFAANTPQRFRIVLVGANRDDLSAARVLFFINEVEVSGGGLTTNLPYNVDLVPFFYTLTGGGASSNEFCFGAIRYRQTIYPGGIF